MPDIREGPSPRRHIVSFPRFVLLIAAATALALAFRLPRLDLRPMHTDEAVHAVKLGILYDTGSYQYNPREYHGPTIYYFDLPFLWLRGVRSFADFPDEAVMRIVPALFGAGLILLLLLMGDAFGRRAAACAGLLTAVSPAMVFYSRYFIQEIPLVFFTFAAIACGWRYSRERKLPWALAAGACLGFMHATKETSIIAYLSMLGAGTLTIAWTRWVGGHQLRLRNYFHGWHLAGALKIAAVVAILCLTALLSNPRATIDSVLTYTHYAQRAGSGDSSMNDPAVHNHPWPFYFHILLYWRYGKGPVWSEAFVVALALVGLVKVLKRGVSEDSSVHFVRFIGFYTILMTIAYALIPYKTPWCLLGFLHGMILLAGVGAAAIFDLPRARRLKTAAALLFLAGAAHLAWQAWRADFVLYADPRNPYVYAHTSPNVLRLTRRAEELAGVCPDKHLMMIDVVVTGSDHWPLPWYLRRFPNVAYFPTESFELALALGDELEKNAADYRNAPRDFRPGMIIFSPDREADIETALEKRGLRDAYAKDSIYSLRPGVYLKAFMREDLWEAFLAARE